MGTDMSDNTKKMFCKELFLWRVSAAIVWSIILQTVFLSVFIFVINIDIFHPIVWIQSTYKNTMSFGTGLYLCTLGVIICAQGVVCSEDFLLNAKHHATRFTGFINIFSLRSLFLLCLHSLIGGVITWLYLSPFVGKYSHSTVRCKIEENMTCLNEEHFFLVLNGFWVGMYFFIHDYIFGLKTLIFPVVQQLKFLQAKTELISTLKQAMYDATAPSVHFLVFYYFYGAHVRNRLVDLFGLKYEGQTLDTITGLLNITLIMYVWFLSTMFILTMYIMRLLFQVYLTQHIMFAISSSTLHNSDTITLHHALAMTEIPIMQYLGYLDLKILADKDRSRREELFTLSQPGGHPYNWNAVVGECLKLINSYIHDLNMANCDEPITDSSQPNRNSSINQNISSMNLKPSSLHTPIGTPRNMNASRVASPPHGFRNLTLIGSSNMPEFEPEGNVPNNMIVLVNLMVSTIKARTTYFLTALCKKPGISYIFGEHPEQKARFILSQGQPVIWAVEGLSLLAAASFKEDKFGIVQKDIPAIIITFLQLKQALEKLQKVGNYKKTSKSEQFDVKMKTALRSAVKRSLYRICNTFGSFVKEFPLPNDVLQQLRAFLLFREG